MKSTYEAFSDVECRLKGKARITAGKCVELLKGNNDKEEIYFLLLTSFLEEFSYGLEYGKSALVEIHNDFDKCL